MTPFVLLLLKHIAYQVTSHYFIIFIYTTPRLLFFEAAAAKLKYSYIRYLCVGGQKKCFQRKRTWEREAYNVCSSTDISLTCKSNFFMFVQQIFAFILEFIF